MIETTPRTSQVKIIPTATLAGGNPLLVSCARRHDPMARLNEICQRSHK